jgi:cell division protease FtsH
MPDEKTGDSPKKSRNPGNAKSEQDAARGPRLPRGFVLVVLLGLFLIFGVSFFTNANRRYVPISLADFQKRWSEKDQAYIGYSKGELLDDVLQVRPIDQGPVPPPKESKPAETKATPDEKKQEGPIVSDRSSGNNLIGGKVETWHRVKIPPSAIDFEFLQRLATIPDFTYEPSNQLLAWMLVYIAFPAFFIAMFYFLVIRPLRSQGGPGNVLAFGRSRPKLIAKDHTGIKFDDVAGVEEAKEEVAEVIEFLKNPQKFQALGGRIPRGLLFVGPPGTGKTLLAKAIAGEADVPFYSISGSDFVEMFVGVGASRVRDLFRQAKENTPCIIFLDEVDAVGRRRGSGLGGGHDEREQTLNAILVEMDGFDTSEQVIVIASTNRPDVLDPALLRPGRFDREIVINLPDVKGRYEILKVHARHIKLSDTVDLHRIARGTPMFSGADLEALINEAAIRATMRGRSSVVEEDLEEARDKVKFGREKRSQIMDEHDRMVTAYHEAGHAVLMLHCQEVEPLHKVTIIPRGMALGVTMQLPLKDKYTLTRRNMLGQIMVLFGGRIAEQMFCDDISSGASSDIQRATDIARRMVCDYGMSEKLGPIRYANKEQHVFLGGEMSQPREFSEATAERIDTAVREIIDQCYTDATELLETHREEIDLLAKALLKHETLSIKEVEQILQQRSIDAISKNGDVRSLEQVVADELKANGESAENHQN